MCGIKDSRAEWRVVSTLRCGLGKRPANLVNRGFGLSIAGAKFFARRQFLKPRNFNKSLKFLGYTLPDLQNSLWRRVRI